MAEHFDALVIGRSLAAFWTAALLAKRKRRVRWMAPDGPPAEAWPVPPLGLKGSPIVRRLLEELGLQHSVRTRLEGPPLAIGVALADRRCTLEVDVSPRGVELGRAFPEQHAALLALFDRIDGYGRGLDALLDGEAPLPPVGFAERRGVRKILADLPVVQLETAPPPALPPPLEALAAALLAVAGRADAPGAPLTAGAARSLYLLCHGLSRWRGGPDTPRALAEEKLESYGGQVDRRRRAARIELDGKTARAVLTHDDVRLTADAIVIGEDDATLHRLCPDACAAPAQAGGACRITLPGHLPPQLDAVTGWQPEPGERGAVLYREGDAVTVVWSGEAPPDLRALLPLLPESPTLALGRRVVALPPGTGPDPLDLWRPDATPAVKHLYRVGSSVVPGLGYEGEALTAWHTARRVDAALQGASLWPFRRR